MTVMQINCEILHINVRFKAQRWKFTEFSQKKKHRSLLLNFNTEGDTSYSSGQQAVTGVELVICDNCREDNL